MSEVITIDGPASSGKSTVGLAFAQRIDYCFIDSGLLYRVATLLALKKKYSPSTGEKIARSLEKAKIKFTENGTGLFLDGKDVSEKLHSPEVTAKVPEVSAQLLVREAVNKVLRRLGSEKNTVMAGRDLGSAIFPGAKLKFFITASPEVRARRRFNQFQERGLNVSYEEILQDILRRDEKDATRATDPLKVPEGALVIDTSNLTIEGSISLLEKSLRC